MLQCYGVYLPMCVCAPSCSGRSRLYLLRPQLGGIDCEVVIVIV